jgi:hypothetical protein
MANKRPSPKQIAARKRFARLYGGKKQKKAHRTARRAKARKAVKRVTHRKAKIMAKHKGKKTAARSSRRAFALAAGAPILKVAGDVAFGRDGMNGLIAGVKSAGFVGGVARGANLLMVETTGYWPGLNNDIGMTRGWHPKYAGENVGLAAAGYVGHKVADKFRVNSTLRRLGSPVVI